MGKQASRRSQQLDVRQVVFADLIHDHVEDHLDVGRVRGRGVVVVHGSVATRREHGCDEMGSGVHIAVGSWGEEKNSLCSSKTGQK